MKPAIRRVSRFRPGPAYAMLIGLAAPMCGWAADAAVRSRLGTEGAPVAFPSLLRLTVGFSLTVVLVVAAMWLLRRYGNRFMRATTGFAVRTLGRATVAPGLRVTVVDVEGLRFLIAESRQHLQVVPLAVRGEVDAASRSQS